MGLVGASGSQTFNINIVPVSGLPPESVSGAIYFVHDTAANIEAATVGESNFNAVASAGTLIGVIVKGVGPSSDSYLSSSGRHVPVVGYDPFMTMPAEARTIDEDQNNSGLLVAFNGSGKNIFSGSEDASRVGVDVVHSYLGAGSVLTAHIDNIATGLGGVAGEILYVRTSSELFRVESDGSIYYRQDTQVSGKNGFVYNGSTYDADVAIIVDASPGDDLLIGHLLSDGSGNFLDGRHNRDLSITLTDLATQDIVELLAGHIGFGIRLNDGSTTQAWGPFASAVPQPSVTMTLKSPDIHDPVATATRQITLVSQNDLPVAHNDLVAIGKGQSNVPATLFTGWVLGNDDPDVLPNKGFGNANVPTDLHVTEVTAGGSLLTFDTPFTSAYGTITFRSNGTYDYTLNTSNSSVKALTTTSNPLLDVFHYKMTDVSGTVSEADLKIMIDALSLHWGREDKAAGYTTAAPESIFKYAGSGQTQYVFGFGDNDNLGAVGPGTVKMDGGDGDDVMFALATYTSLKGGSGADKFVVGSADIHVRIEDLDLTPASKDTVDLLPLFTGMSQSQVSSYISTHTTEAVDVATGKMSATINFNELGTGHTGDVTFVGINAASIAQVQFATTSTNYTLLDELRLIAANHG